MKQTIWIALLALATVSCTRPEAESTKVKLTIPNSKLQQGISAQSTLPSHVVVNVNREDGKKTFCSFDAKWEQAEGPCDFSQFPEVSVMTPPGAKQLFQILTVEEVSGGGMTFNYGDATADISTSAPPVAITLSLLGSGTGSGHIIGRFIDSKDTASNPVGPTGVLSLEIEAPNGRPPLLIDRSEVFAGWFNAFVIGGIKIQYRVNGVLRFGKAMGMEDFIAIADGANGNTAGVQRISYEVPVGGSTEFQFAGFAGPGLVLDTTRRTCSSTQFSTECTSSTEFVGYLSPASSHFLGPFQDSGGIVSISASMVGWNLLPGAETAIDGVEVIVLPGKATDPDLVKLVGRGDRKVDCMAAKALPGAVSSGKIPVGTNTANMSPLDFSSGTHAVFVCPYKGNFYFQTAATNINIEGSGGNNMPYLRVEGLPYGGTPLAKNFCQQVELKTFEPCNGGTCVTHNVLTAVSITLPNNADIQFFSNSTDCGSGTNPVISASIAVANYSSGLLWVKIASSSNLTSFPFSLISISSTEVNYDQGSYEVVPIQ